jgi:thiol oxidase
VLLAMRGYIAHFFGCKECATNFGKMAATIGASVHTPRDSVLFLWSAHNRANKRLHGDVTEDPAFPKIPFPAPALCETCQSPEGDWNEDAVYEFLLGFYAHRSLIRDSKVLDIELMNDAQSDLRKKDLEMIRKLRIEKQQRKEIADMEMGQSKIPVNPKIIDLKRQEFETRMSGKPVSFGFSGVDMSMCVSFYVVSGVILLYLYFHFTVKKRCHVSSRGNGYNKVPV